MGNPISLRPHVSPDARAAVRYLLVNPPLTDPTVPYHSISYLIGRTSAAGYTGFSALDANLEGLEFLARPEQVGCLLDECDARMAAIEAKDGLTRRDELTYRYALKAVGLRPDSVARAIAILKDPERFYHHPTYRQAVVVLNRWLDVMSVRGFPGQFRNFNLVVRAAGNLGSLTDLCDPAYLETFGAVMSPYFDGPLRDQLSQGQWDMIGLSVNYVSQLPYAILLAKLIRELNPDCLLCAGGTEISDDVKYLRNPGDIWRLFPDCDALVVGEGETALVQILEAVATGTSVPSSLGILLPGEPSGSALPAVRFEDLDTAASPRYDIWNWERYWAPEPVVLYSPTRGCYWNKCTFCDYGLNTDGPTSPARNRPIAEAIRELREITATGRTVYLSVDAISPAYLRQLAKAIVAEDIHIRWAAELRLERSFVKGLAQELSEAGCVAISFGYEAGSQRVIDLIQKGVKLDQVPAVLAELSRVGIAAQMMGFVGFPGETSEEATETFAFLHRNAEHWTIAAIGDFSLTPGAIVAKSPADFGVSGTFAPEGDDIVRFLQWSYGDDGARAVPPLESDADLRDVAAGLPWFGADRPFVGGVDSSHSILYFSRYGPVLVPPELRAQPPTETLVASGHRRGALRGADRLVSWADVGKLHWSVWGQGGSASFAMVNAWLDQPSDCRPVDDEAVGRGDEVIEVLANGDFIVLSAAEARIEADAGAAYHLLRSMLLQETSAI